MDQQKNPDMVTRRAELLATVALTRRLNIDVLPMDLESGIDFIGIIRPAPDEDIQGFLIFGIAVKGTAQPLPSASAAKKHFQSNRRNSGAIKGKYFIPVIVLLFTMSQDEGYFAWLAEPDHRSVVLTQRADLTFESFNLEQLDLMTQRIKKWYQRLSSETSPV